MAQHIFDAHGVESKMYKYMRLRQSILGWFSFCDPNPCKSLGFDLKNIEANRKHVKILLRALNNIKVMQMKLQAEIIRLDFKNSPCLMIDTQTAYGPMIWAMLMIWYAAYRMLKA